MISESMNNLEAVSLLFKQYHSWLAISVFVLLLVWETVAPYLGFFRRRLAARAQHAARNLCIGALNAVMIGGIFSSLWLIAGGLSEVHQFGLAYRLHLSGWVHLLFAILMMDLWTYWWHRWNHEVRFLWRFHSVHHSDKGMDVTTAYRFHFGEITISSLLRIILLYCLGIHLWQLVAYEMIMFSIVQFHHANVGLPHWLDRALRVIIVTPDMHKVHHSTDWSELNSNYTSLLSVWDRLFGTFKIREDCKDIQFGVPGWEDEGKQTLWGMVKTPVAEFREK